MGPFHQLPIIIFPGISVSFHGKYLQLRNFDDDEIAPRNHEPPVILTTSTEWAVDTVMDSNGIST